MGTKSAQAYAAWQRQRAVSNLAAERPAAPSRLEVLMSKYAIIEERILTEFETHGDFWVRNFRPRAYLCEQLLAASVAEGQFDTEAGKRQAVNIVLGRMVEDGKLRQDKPTRFNMVAFYSPVSHSPVGRG